MKKNPKPKTQTLWAVVWKPTGQIFRAYARKDLAQSHIDDTTQEVQCIRRLTVPAFAPKRRKSK